MSLPHSAVPVPGHCFRCAIPVRWGDLDALNHVNNTEYFRYLEEARVQLLERAGIRLPGEKVAVLAHASCDFIRPVLYPETVVVVLVLAHVGRSSLRLDVRIESQDDPAVVYATGHNVIVGANLASGQSVPWTQQELAALASSLVADSPANPGVDS